MGKNRNSERPCFFELQNADGDCNHEIKRPLLLGRKDMINLDSILKSRDITLPTKICLVKAMVFPVVVYGYESWTIKKLSIKKRIDTFEVCVGEDSWVPCTARRSNQSILKEVSPEYSLEGLLLKLKHQCFGYLMRRTDSFENILMLGKIEDGRRWGWQDEMVSWHHQLHGHEFEQALGVGDGQGSLGCCSPWGCKESDMTEQLNWLICTYIHIYLHTHTSREREKLILLQNLQGRLKCWRPKKEVLW